MTFNRNDYKELLDQQSNAGQALVDYKDFNSQPGNKVSY